VRAFPAFDPSPADLTEHWLGVPNTDKGPWVFLYELPGTATLSSVSARLANKNDKGGGTTATFAASTTGPDSGFKDIATLVSGATGDRQTVSTNGAAARWVRITISNNSGATEPIADIAAYGSIAPPPANTNVGGIYVQYDNPYGNKTGAFANAPDNKDPWYLRVVTAGADGINGEQCFDGHLGDSYPGTRTGRTWTWKSGDNKGTFVANDEGTMLVATDGNGAYWIRSDKKPKFCEPQNVGNGHVNVVVLNSRNWPALFPVMQEDQADVKGYRFEHLGASMVDQDLLNTASIVMLNGLCQADDLFNAAQDQLLQQWVSAGHKLLIYDSDMCDKPTHYSMLPYQFQSDNPGAAGAKGDRLIQVEDDTLGTSDKSDKAHFFDPQVYASGYNQLGDANTVTTQDPHWCGHLFGTNVHHVNGFMQMYANVGKGVIIYDGFDHDDGGNASYRRIRMLELGQPIPADLPCTQQASLAFVIEPNRTGKFVPGKAQTMTFPMELLANQGWKGHVNASTSGDLKGSVTPNSFDVAGGTVPLKIAVNIPANAKPGTYNVLVTGDAGNKQTAQATIQLTAAVPIVKQFQQKRIRLYGIHFDVDKATIKPQSEPVIAQIAAVMKQNPAWRFRVEGHTDSDGGYQHNMVLSQHRAESVVNDLVNRYHIARSRLVPVGYGYSHPVAPNTTAAGKALNRRVELVRL
jgi:outer membrane protein OmpA-like peptidoglycan-associated protein